MRHGKSAVGGGLLGEGEVSVVAATWDAASGVGRVRLNGVEVASGVLVAPKSSSLLVGAPLRGRVGEILLFDRVLAAGELEAVEASLGAKFGAPFPAVVFDAIPGDGAVVPRDVVARGRWAGLR